MLVNFRFIGELSAVLTLILMAVACDKPRGTADVDAVPPQAVQRTSTNLVEPHRYLRLTDLAAAIRKAGLPCEVVRAYKQIEQRGKGSGVYKIDCLEYSFRLTMINGQSRIEPWPAN